MQHFEVDYLFGQMEQGSGSGVAKVTHESKKHKISEGSSATCMPQILKDRIVYCNVRTQ